MAIAESTHPSSLQPENTDLLRRYCPGLAIHGHEKLAGYLLRDAVTDCWHWTGLRRTDGYGWVTLEPTAFGYYESMHAHRYMYATLVGDIPAGLAIHHRCEVKDCWNPFHLEAVTPQEHADRHRKSPTHVPVRQAPVQLGFAFVT